MTDAGTAQRLVYEPAKVISLKDNPNFNEAWRERQIQAKGAVLGLGKLAVKHTQRIQKTGRLDILAEDESEQYLYAIELMLGELDASHIVRAIDFWLYEQAREKRESWETVAVIVAEGVRESRFYNVVRFLSEKMPLVVIQMHALQVGDLMTLDFTKLFDGRDQLEDGPTPAPVEVNEQYWKHKSSEQSVEVVKVLGKVLKAVDSEAHINWNNKEFVGVRVGNKAMNFVLFVPKKQWVRVHARSIADTDNWSRRLEKAGFKVIGGTPGRSIHFHATKETVRRGKTLLERIFRECRQARLGGEYE